MKNNLHRALAAALIALLATACSRGPDPEKEFGIYLNGKSRNAGVADPVGRIQELEAGYSYSYRYSVVFPLKISAVRGLPRPGILVEFDPGRIEPGGEISFGSGMESPVRVEYHPTGGHKMNRAVMLAYSSDHGPGGGKIRFEVLETGLGGRVRGSVIQATLYGYYENMETMEVSEPPKPMKLELFNWPFEVTLERSIF